MNTEREWLDEMPDGSGKEYSAAEASSGVEPELVNPGVEARTERAGSDNLIVIGIGASAGGLVALREFFENIPPDTGMTFVVVVHLSPEHESMLAELLQGYTPMPVRQVQARLAMEPNYVYIIPPGKRLVVDDAHLDLTSFEMPHGRRLQIDTFFRSLAEEHGDGAGIILSGSGSDGAVGIQSIKEQGGLVLVQSPEEAEYDGMPKSSIATGLVDIVAPVAELAKQLVAAKRTKAALQFQPDAEQLTIPAQHTLEQILIQLRLRTGHDFNGYKRATLLRRVARRMQVVQQTTLSGYLNYLRQDGEEADALYRDLLIHVTEFFRDAPSWQYLEEKVIPQVFEGKSFDDTIRVWTVGCATGEEAYGIAMLLLEHAATLEVPPRLQVFASDLGKLVLDFARAGIYPEAIAADVSEERLQRFFIKDNSHYRVRSEVRDMVLFAPHNLLQDPPFSKLDLVICRNLLIYLERPAQTRVFESFYYALRAEGHLFLGSAESVDGVSEIFDIVSKAHRIYRRSPRQLARLLLPPLTLPPRIVRGNVVAEPPSRNTGNELERHRLLLEEIGLPSLLVDESYHIVHYSETVGRYLQHPSGRPTNDVTRLVRAELQPELRLALHRAFTQSKATRTRPIPVRFNGAPHPVIVLVRPAPQSERVLIIFFEVEDDLTGMFPDNLPPLEPDTHNHELQDELQLTQQLLQTSHEDYETTVEELRAANEELQSTNEEYRSTLEELDTSKEELQSINEELQSVNQEMRSRVDELTESNSDLQNLFAATGIATLFLDRELQVKRYTPRAAELFNLMAPDRGRPISHLRANLAYAALEADARRVLNTLIPIEREVEGEGNDWYLVGVRPYRTIEDKIDGVVITLVDITENKQAENVLREAKEYAESIIQTIPDALLVLTKDLRVQSANDAFYTMFQAKPQDTIGRLVYELGNHQWNIPALRDLLEKILPEDKVFQGYEVDHTFEDIGRRTMLLNGRQLDHVDLILLAMADITKRKQAEEKLLESQQQLSAILAQLPVAVGVIDNTGNLVLSNSLMQSYVEQKVLSLDPLQFSRWQALDRGGMPIPEHELLGARAVRGEATSLGVEFHFVDDQNMTRWLLVSSVPFRGMNDEIVGGILVTQDITADKQAEAELRRSEEQYRTLFVSMDEGFCTVEVIFNENNEPFDYRFIEYNPAFERQTGLTDAMGKRMRELVPGHEEYWYEIYGKVAVTGESMRFVNRAAALERWYDVYAFRIGAPAKRRVAVIFNDISERVQNEEALVQAYEKLEMRVAERTAQVSNLVIQLTMSEQEERRRISTILHDDLQQRLFSLMFQLQSIRQGLDATDFDATRQIVDEVEAEVRDSIKITRDLSVDLSPPVLHDEGLVQAVQWLAHQMWRQYQLEVDVQGEEKLASLDEDLRVQLLFQIVRELLFNVVKHAGVKAAKVAVSQADHFVHVVVSDQGRGFDTEAVNGKISTTQGLQRIRQRLQLLGGNLEVTSAAGQGTRITMSTPLHERGEKVT